MRFFKDIITFLEEIAEKVLQQKSKSLNSLKINYTIDFFQLKLL